MPFYTPGTFVACRSLADARGAAGCYTSPLKSFRRKARLLDHQEASPCASVIKIEDEDTSDDSSTP